MMEIPQDILNSVLRWAEATYPHECCGILLGPLQHPHQITQLEICTNIQDRLHAEDPVQYPRNARTAYTIDPLELLHIQKSARVQQLEIRVIFHSHIDAEAEFSAMDREQAVFGGEPIYPQAQYWVISVINGKVGAQAFYSWSRTDGEFRLSR